MRWMTENRNGIFIGALTVLYIISVLVNLGKLELAGEEPRRAVIAIEMFHSGNYISPTLLGWDYFNKPPLFNWILCFFIWITDSASAFVMRLPSLLFYLLMAVFHYRVARHFLSQTASLLSAVFIVTCGDVYFYGLANGAEIDIFYGLIVYLQAISLFWFYHHRKFGMLFLVSYFFCAIGFLTKAFPSILFQVLTLGALCVYAQSVKILFSWKHLAGVALFVSILAVYFLAYSRYNSPYQFLTNLLNEAFLKSAVGERAGRLPEKAAMYPVLFLKMLAPWSLLLLLLFTKVRFRLWQNSLVKFSILFIIFNIGVYWFTGQPKIRYVYMFLPFACTFLAYIYQRYAEERPQAFNKILRLFGFIFLAVGIGICVVPFFEKLPLLPVVVFALVFLLLSYRYFFDAKPRIWLMIVGIVLMRLLYAVLFIPLQHKALNNYQLIVNNMVGKTGGAPIVFKASPVQMPVSLTTSIFRYDYDTVSVAPVVSYQMPYYYYLHTGHVMKMDTQAVSPAYKFSYVYQMGEERKDTLLHFFDWNMNADAFLYR